jgi:hypothetical protein
MESTKLLIVQNQLAKASTVWILFLFFGWSYGSLGKIGMQILFWITLGGMGIWAFVRLFTLSSSIKEYNRQIAINGGLNQEEMMMLGLY